MRESLLSSWSLLYLPCGAALHQAFPPQLCGDPEGAQGSEPGRRGVCVREPDPLTLLPYHLPLAAPQPPGGSGTQSLRGPWGAEAGIWVL